jgi:4-hydroxybenzoate polyprenyltransferase/geranylgeranylglycerol-phosphate geranylgeranyltransferase
MLLAGALIAAGWTLPPALAVVLPLLAVSLYAQARMRSRHEFPELSEPPGPAVPGPAAGVPAAREAGEAPRTAHDLRGDVRSC